MRFNKLTYKYLFNHVLVIYVLIFLNTPMFEPPKFATYRSNIYSWRSNIIKDIVIQD